MASNNEGPGCGGPAQDFAPEAPRMQICCGGMKYEEKEALTFSRLQFLVAAWQDYNFGPQAPYRQLLGVAEEFGELCHAQLKLEQGIRGTPEEHKAAAKDAVGDILIFLSNYCTGVGFNLQEIAEDTWAEISKRDWKKFPKNGVSE